MHIVLSQLNLISLLFTILAVVTAAVVVLAQSRRISHDQLNQVAKDWQDIATAKGERVNLLQSQQASLQSQILELTARIAGFEKDQQYLERRNREVGQALEVSKMRVEHLEIILRDAQPPARKKPGTDEAGNPS